jgi:phytoene dehydrogenase-like protein
MESSKGIISFYWKIRLFIKLFVSGLFSKRNWSASKLMDYYFSNEKLQLVFISIIADFFTPPSKFPGLGVFSLNPEAIYDKRMPKLIEKNTKQLYHYDILGGVSKLVDILVEEFKNAGGTLKLNTEITEIIVKQNKVQGVLDDKGKRIPFNIIIASGSAKKTFFDLVGKKNLSHELWSIINNLKLMESVFMVHLGLDNEYDPSEYNNNYVVRYYYQIDTTKELEESINDERNGSYHKGEKGFVVYIPTLHSPEMAPKGHHAMTIYTICPDKLRESSWSQKKEKYAHKLIQYAEDYFPNLHKHIKVQEIVTPEDFRKRLNVDHHAFGGIAPYLGMVRVPHKTPINGLWFIGAESESGGGLNNVIPGAFKTAKIIEKYFS